MKTLILVLGTPGVGKSTLASALASRLDYQMVDLGLEVMRKKLYRGFDRTRMTYIVDEPRVRRRLRTLLSKGDLIVATHSIGKTILSRWVSLAFVLRLDPVLLYRRLRAKGWTRAKSWENAESELIDVCFFEAVSLVGKNKVVEINTTSKSRPKVLSEVIRIVNHGRRVSDFRVNWLETYDPVVLARRLSWKKSY